MTKYFKITFFLLTTLLLSLSSCSKFTSVKITDKDCKEVVNKGLSEHIKGIKDFDILKITLRSSEELEDKVSTVSVFYKIDEKFKSSTLILKTPERSFESNPSGYFLEKELKGRIPKKYNEFDYSKAASNIEKAKEMIKTDYPEAEFKSVYSYTMSAGLSKETQEDLFKIQVVSKKNSKETKLVGKKIVTVTDYYEIDFKVTESGDVTYVD